MFARGKIDKPFLFISIILIVAGFFVFSSASLALFAKENSNYSSVLLSQTVFGLFMGTVALTVASRLNQRFWKKASFYLLLLAIILNILVFVPGVSFEHGGGRRWLIIGSLSFQPSEFLKLAFILYFAAWADKVKEKIKTFRWGLLPLLILFAIAAVLLLIEQRDTGSFMLIGVAGTAMFIVAGGKWRHILLLALLGLMTLFALAIIRPYVKDRIMTFFNPQSDPLNTSWQVQQSLISIGSGGIFGTGFGTGVHKYTFLPEPIGDSIFAVLGQEFGFAGAVTLVVLFVLFASRGLKIASQASSVFARLAVAGIVIMITTQAFVNIGAMLGLVPLSGITLPFVSHGGTSLFFTLLGVGIVLSFSRTAREK